MNIPDCIKEHCFYHQLVGSRVTCTPPPTDTDQDVLCMVNDWNELIANLEELGWQFDGSEHYANALDEGVGFRSYRNGDVNLILTTEFEFYSRFMAATSIAKHLNLLKKEDRIALFQAVLYGNPYVDPNPINLELAEAA